MRCVSAFSWFKFRKVQHRGHKGSQRTTEKLNFFFRRPLFSVSSRPSVLSVAFLRVLCVKFRKAQHRGHKVSQRATEKSAFPFSVVYNSVQERISLRPVSFSMRSTRGA